jgi:dTDP-4-amino-4,6-dideoxygalactose transaminase
VNTSLTQIPFNRPSLAGNELRYVADAVARGHISGNGWYTKESEDLLAMISGSSKVLLTTSCTHALELSARILRLGPEDEVIVPAYTFVSTASAFALSGARPIFVDVTPGTLNLDVDAAASAITSRTKAICTVHYAGIAEDLDRLVEVCTNANLALIEDNAHGLGARFDGKLLGTFGDMSTLSFHETKNVTCGEGGALALNNDGLLPLAEILREKGTDRARFLRGQVDKYTWMEIGSSWVTSDILAAYLLAQLEEFDRIQSKRMDIWNSYDLELSGWATSLGIRKPYIPKQSEHAAHMYYLQFQSLVDRTSFIDYMKSLGIMTVFHYQALNKSSVGISLGGRTGQCPISEKAADTVVRLPLFADMSSDELNRVIGAATSFGL